MPASSSASVLITGANSGIGKEVARQFAESGSFDTIYLACRNHAKAEAARTDLERATAKSMDAAVANRWAALMNASASWELSVPSA